MNILRPLWAGKELGDRTIPVFVEGFLLFHHRGLCDSLHALIWLEADRETCMGRRRSRGKKKRKYPKQFNEWYRNEVWTAFQRYRSTQLANAKRALQLDGKLPPDELLQRVTKHLQQFAQEAGNKTGDSIIRNLLDKYTASTASADAKEQQRFISDGSSVVALHPRQPGNSASSLGKSLMPKASLLKAKLLKIPIKPGRIKIAAKSETRRAAFVPAAFRGQAGAPACPTAPSKSATSSQDVKERLSVLQRIARPSPTATTKQGEMVPTQAKGAVATFAAKPKPMLSKLARTLRVSLARPKSTSSGRVAGPKDSVAVRLVARGSVALSHSKPISPGKIQTAKAVVLSSLSKSQFTLWPKQKAVGKATIPETVNVAPAAFQRPHAPGAKQLAAPHGAVKSAAPRVTIAAPALSMAPTKAPGAVKSAAPHGAVKPAAPRVTVAAAAPSMAPNKARCTAPRAFTISAPSAVLKAAAPSSPAAIARPNAAKAAAPSTSSVLVNQENVPKAFRTSGRVKSDHKAPPNSKPTVVPKGTAARLLQALRRTAPASPSVKQVKRQCPEPQEAAPALKKAKREVEGAEMPAKQEEMKVKEEPSSSAQKSKPRKSAAWLRKQVELLAVKEEAQVVDLNVNEDIFSPSPCPTSGLRSSASPSSTASDSNYKPGNYLRLLGGSPFSVASASWNTQS